MSPCFGLWGRPKMLRTALADLPLYPSIPGASGYSPAELATIWAARNDRPSWLVQQAIALCFYHGIDPTNQETP
jgi:hypothetical protein